MRPSLSRRSCAFVLDGVIALLLAAIGSWGWVLAVGYLVSRDGFWRGQSVGKKALRLRVVDRQGGSGIGFVDSLKRNLLFAIPLLNAAISMAVFEGVVLYFDEDGLRIGDRIAGTRVIRS